MHSGKDSQPSEEQERNEAALAFFEIAWTAKSILEGFYNERYEPNRWLQWIYWLEQQGVNPVLIGAYA